MTSNPDLLSSTLKAHVVKGAYTSKHLIEGKTLTTLAGNKISLSDIHIERADIKLEKWYFACHQRRHSFLKKCATTFYVIALNVINCGVNYDRGYKLTCSLKGLFI
jgi:hypothetical protein